MPTTRPFAYNTGTTISGTTQSGSLAIGVATQDYSGNPNGITWWMGPDESLGYVVAYPDPTRSHPTHVAGTTAGVGFLRSQALTDPSFISIVNYISGQKYNLATDAKAWLDSNNKWTSFILKGYMTTIASSYYSNVAIDSNSTVWVWGDNIKNELGINSTVCKCSPVSILGARKTFCSIAMGQKESVLVLDKYGQAWGWGYNYNAQLGTFSNQTKGTPVSVMGAKKTFCKISTGFNNSFAIDNRGQLWGWGNNSASYGYIGNNSAVNQSTPVSILGAKKTFCSVITKYTNTMALTYSGQIWAWGIGSGGALGNNSTIAQSTPVSILGAKKTFCIIDQTVVSSSLAIDYHGQIWTWGAGTNGQLGNNSTIAQSTPVSILGAKKTFCDITGGNSKVGAVDNRGLIWTWGGNQYGELGNNLFTFQSTPVSILGAKKTFCAVVAGDASFTAIDNHSKTWGWGYNRFGVLGDGRTTCILTPMSIIGQKKTFCNIGTGLNITGTVDNRGQIWTWGLGASGALGNNSIIILVTPTSILGAKKTFCDISLGNSAMMGLDKNGLAWGWGNNGYGLLGNNSTVCQSTPVSILGAKKTFCTIESSSYNELGLDNRGQIWNWGNNNLGQLGINSTVCQSTPVSILGAKKTFCQISSGASFGSGLDNRGQIWTWGTNAQGQLGINSTVCQSTPVSILGAKKTFCSIAMGGVTNSSIAALDKNGLVWCWGNNQFGQLGVGTVLSKQTPVSILGAKKTFCKIATSIYLTIGIDLRGQIWNWGYGSTGLLGNGTSICQCTPVSILGAKKTFCKIQSGPSTSMATDNHGNTWVWGLNSYLVIGAGYNSATPIRMLL